MTDELIKKIATEGFYAIGTTYPQIGYYGDEEILVDYYNERFVYQELNEKPYEDECAWYEKSFDFADFGKWYFLTKEEAEARVEEIMKTGERPKYKERYL